MATVGVIVTQAPLIGPAAEPVSKAAGRTDTIFGLVARLATENLKCIRMNSIKYLYKINFKKY